MVPAWRSAVLQTLACLTHAAVSPTDARLFASLERHGVAELSVKEMVLQAARHLFRPGGLLVVNETVGAFSVSTLVLRAATWPLVMPALSVSPKPSPSGSDCPWLGRLQAAGLLLAGSLPEVEAALRWLRFACPPLWSDPAAGPAALLLLRGAGSQDAALPRWLLTLRASNATVVLLDEAAGDAVGGALGLYAAAECPRAARPLQLLDTWLPDSASFARGLTALPRGVQRGSMAGGDDCTRCPVLATRYYDVNSLAYADEHNAFWELFSDVMQHLGCAMQAVEDKRDLDLPPGLKPSAPLRRLQTGEADVAAMSFGLTLARMRNMTPSATFKTDRIVVLVTESRSTRGPFAPLEIAAASVLVIVVVVHWCLHHARSAIQGDAWRQTSFLDSLMVVWPLFYANPGPRALPASWSSLLWGSVALTAVTVNALRQSLYASQAINPGGPTSTTLEHLVDAGVPIGVTEAFLYDLLCATSSELAAEGGTLARARWSDCFSDTAGCMSRFSESHGDFALTAFEIFPGSWLSSMSDDVRRRVRKVDDRLLMLHAVVFWARGHPLVTRASAMVGRLHSAGLALRRRKHASLAGGGPRIAGAGRRRTPPSALSMRQLRSAFLVPAYLMIAGALTFLLEVAVGRFHQRRLQ